LSATWVLLALLAHDPITTKITWDAEISRIVNKRCLSCHAAGSSVDLSGYEQVRPWAKSIRNQVLERRMPPWAPVKGFGAFRNDPSLTPLEMEMITQWVEGGAPEGDPAFLPKRVSMEIAPPHPQFHWSPAPRVAQQAKTVAAIRASGPTEVSAILPDGTIEHLLWIRDKKADWKRAYVFRDPVPLPAGTRLQVTGAPVEFSVEARR
jgi:hypothetical protein